MKKRFSYLDNKSWNDVTRDERYFCCELFHQIKKDVNSFVRWLYNNRKISINESEIDNVWEISFEVCFYRDYVKKIGYLNPETGEREHRIGRIVDLNIPFTTYKDEVKTIDEFPRKRTFDLCLFSEDRIIIIEAKSHQGFDKKQLDDFLLDRLLIEKLFGSTPSVEIIGLCSSKYNPSKFTRSKFYSIFNWNELIKLYPEIEDVLKRADKCKGD
ncbi:MAG: hypothetical protein C0594_01245 [Marinilabiliales bacterium]|nr:MAG: hypothetical protein C0594_01245 [Marinilabiliales bacterium]